MTKNKVIVTWDEFLKDLKVLAEKLPCHLILSGDKIICAGIEVGELGINPSRRLKIWGPPRNGTIITGIICHQREDLKLIVSNSEKEIKETFDIDEIIILDDICCSGATLKPYQEVGYITAAVYQRYSSEIEVDYYGKLIEHDDFLVFPWEKE